MGADPLDHRLRGSAAAFHRQAHRSPGDVADVDVRTGRQRRRRRLAAATTTGAAALVLVALVGHRTTDTAVRLGGTPAPRPSAPTTAPVPPPAPPTTPSTAPAAPPPPAPPPASTGVPTPVPPSSPPPAAPPSTVAPTRPAGSAGRSFALAGGGCLFDGRPGTLTVELRGTGPGARRLPLTPAGGVDGVAAAADGSWTATPVVPDDVAPGAYPAVPVCTDPVTSRTADLTAAVTVVRVGGSPATVATTPAPRPGG